MASWILEEIISKNIKEVEEIEEAKQFYELLFSQETNIEKFTQIFLDTRKHEVVIFWGWRWWEEREEGKVYQIKSLEKLEKFYVVKSLSWLQKMSDEEIQKIKLPPDKTLAYLAEDDKHLNKILKDIEKDKKQALNKWKSVLEEEATEKIGPFNDLLSEAKIGWEEEERKIKREREISPGKVKEFKQEVLESFDENAYMRDVFVNHLKTYKDESEQGAVGEERLFRLIQADDKAVFFDKWDVHYHYWGKKYGRDIGYGENYALFSDIAKLCKEIPQENFDTTLLNSEKPDNLFILATTGESVDFIDIRKNFKHNLSSGLKGLIGEYSLNGRSFPVFRVPYYQSKEQILILNKEKIGKLIQLSPLNKEEDRKLIEDIFYMNIQSFSENKELMEKFIKEPPNWLQGKGDEERQREYLKERVLIQIFERFEFEKVDDFEGYKVILKKQ